MNEVPRVLSAPVPAQDVLVAGGVNPNPSPLLPVFEEVNDPVADEKAVERTSARVTSSVVFVSDLNRSVEFYRDVFSCEVRIEAYEAALLLSPRGLQIYLIARGARAPHPSGGIGLQYLIWGVDDPDELNDLEQAIQAHVGRTYRHTSGGITFLTGRDPGWHPDRGHASQPRATPSRPHRQLPVRVMAEPGDPSLPDPACRSSAKTDGRGGRSVP